MLGEQKNVKSTFKYMINIKKEKSNTTNNNTQYVSQTLLLGLQKSKITAGVGVMAETMRQHVSETKERHVG